MKFTDFIGGYEKSKDKQNYLRKYIKTDYIPFAVKVGICKGVLDAAHYKEVAGKKYYKSNTPAEVMISEVRFFMEYIDVDFSDMKPLTIFDEITRTGIKDNLFDILCNEWERFSDILRDMAVDLENDETSLVAFLTTKFDAMEKMFDAIEPILQDKMVDLKNNKK